MCDCVESVLKKRTDGQTEGRTVKVDSRDPPDPKKMMTKHKEISIYNTVYIIKLIGYMYRYLGGC